MMPEVLPLNVRSKFHQDYEVRSDGSEIRREAQAQESILFKVVPKKNIFQKIAEPVVQKLNKEEGKKQENMNDGEKKTKKKKTGGRGTDALSGYPFLHAVAAGGWYMEEVIDQEWK
ncbi:MAG: hypothetical protein ACLU80_01950 [Dorea sp.]